MADIVAGIKEKAAQKKKTIVLPESTDPRMVKAAEQIAQEGFAEIVFIGDPGEIKKVADNEGANISSIQVIEPDKSENKDQYVEQLYELRKHKGIEKADAEKMLDDPLYYAAMMVKSGDADGYVAGAVNTTGDTFRPALQIIKTAPGVSIVSSCFIMIVPECELGENGVFVFADCALNPNPEAEELAEIAISTAETTENLLDFESKVAMLSFSTKGSAQHELVDKVVEAKQKAQEKKPELRIDGELQLDAAIVPSVGDKKAPDSSIAGNANTLIFPDLQSANIGYKLVQRLANARPVGPVTQGLDMPVNDLSRGCSVQEIIDTVAVTAVQAQE